MAWLGTWQKRRKITVDSTNIDSDLTHFAIPLFLGTSVGITSADVSSIFDEVGANKKKIAVTKDDGTTQIYVEIEQWDNVGENAVLWVSKSDLVLDSGSDTDLYIYYDVAQSDNTSYVGEVGSRTEVWDSNFKAVWHLAESSAGNPGEFIDSTSNNHDGQGINSPSQVDAIIYKGQQGGATKYITVPDSDDFYLNGDLTIEWKMHWISSVSNCSIMGQSEGGGGLPKWFINYGDVGAGYIGLYTGSNYVLFAWAPSADTDYHCQLKREGNNWKFFVNSSQVGGTQSNSDSLGNISSDFRLLNEGESWKWCAAKLDETRITKGLARSDAWIKAAYYSDTDGFVTYGSEESVTESIIDIDTDIRVKLEDLEDLATDIRAKYQEDIVDINSDIRAKVQDFIDLSIDIRAKLEEHFIDVGLDIRTQKEEFYDIDNDIRVVESILEDIKTDIRIKSSVIEDLDTDIRAVVRDFSDLLTDIRVLHRISVNQVVISELSIDEGQYLASNNVTINMKVYGAIKMQFKNESGGSWSALENYSDTKSWSLAPGDGSKQVFIRFTDIHNTLSDGLDVIEAIVDSSTPTSVNIEAYTDDTATIPILDSTYQTDLTPFFRWGIPTSNIPYIGFNYGLDTIPDDLGSFSTPDIVQSGILVSKKSPTTNMIFEAASGYYYFKMELKEFNTQEITLSDGDLTNPRIDVIYISGTSESLNFVEGAPDSSPEEPSIPEDAVKLATILVPAGTTKSEDTTLTDTRELYVELERFLEEPLTVGKHVLNVKAICANGLVSAVSTFNIWVANSNPIIGEILCYRDSSKVIELENGVYQTVDNTPYFEWDATASEPGPIRYYYSEDGEDPDISDSYVLTNNYTPTIYSEGITILKVRPYDVTTGYFGETRSFTFIYGTQVFTNDTAVICGSIFLKQSLKEIQVKDISWDFDSARTCKIFQPVAFDATLPFTEGDTISVVYGTTTVFTGKIKETERTIDISSEGVLYHCSDARQELSESYAYVIDDNFGETAQIVFNNISLSSAIDTIISKFPKIVKKVQNYPTGANITDEYVGQPVSTILDSIYSKTKYGWYIKPNGTLVSIDLTAINAGQAKFGIYGTTVHATSPQYNVMASNLKFDATNRYNKCIIEGAKKQERVTLRGKCGIHPKSGNTIITEGDRSEDILYKVFTLDTKWNVVKIIETYVNYARLKKFILVPIGDNIGGAIYKFIIIFLETEICRSNNITRMKRDVKYTTRPSNTEVSTDGTPSESTDSKAALNMEKRLPGYGAPYISYDTEIQGSLGADNTVRFSRAMYNFWPNGLSVNSDQLVVTPGINIDQIYGVPNYYWQNPPEKKCASLSADVIIETIPLKVTVSVSGTADSVAKTLRLVNTSFRYSEDPEDPIDDTAKMTQYATDLLEKYKDIKVNGSITLDTIDLTWDLDKTVNLINTDHAGWDSLNAKVVGIRYNFDDNTTTLEITSEYLK